MCVTMRRMEGPQRLGVTRIHDYLKSLLSDFNNILKLPKHFNGLHSIIKSF